MPVCVIYGSYQIASKARQLQIAAKRNIFSLDLYNYLMQVCVIYGQFQIARNARLPVTPDNFKLMLTAS